MSDVFTKKQRSELMKRIRSTHTAPERAVRSYLHRLGYRFRVCVNTLPGKPDIVLPRFGTAIQVRGCFWHGHTCIDGHVPKSRADYWPQKLRSNAERDLRNDVSLRRLGWTVIIVWECECSSRAKLARTIEIIVETLQEKSHKA